jgi:hypothetical protein
MAVFELTEPSLRIAARRAYERGRLEGGLWRGAAAAILAMPAFAVCNQTPWAGLCLAGLALVVAAGRLRGLSFEDGTRAGALAGVTSCLLPAAVRLLDPELCLLLSSRGPWLCAVGGVAAGVILAWRGWTARDLPFWAGALTALGFGAALGCIPAGILGFVGLAAGFVAGSAPVVLSRKLAG